MSAAGGATKNASNECVLSVEPSNKASYIGGFKKTEFLKESTCMKVNWNFLKGGGLEPKSFHGRGAGLVWVFSGTKQKLSQCGNTNPKFTCDFC